MDLLDLLQKSGGSDSIGQLASAVGLDSSDASKLVASLAPALMGSLSKNVSGGGLAGLQQAIEKGSHDRYISDTYSVARTLAEPSPALPKKTQALMFR